MVRAEALQEAEQLLGIEGVELVVGPGARLAEWPMDDDDGHGGIDVFDGFYKIGTGHLGHFRIHHDSVDGRETPQGIEGLSGAIGGEDVELRGLDDKLAGGNASRVFAVNHQKARAMRK